MKLTPTAERALRALRTLQDAGERPSLVEWAEASDLGYQTILRHKSAFLADGLIHARPNQTRSWRITDKGRKALRKQGE